MLRLAFDFIITWRETRTRPNAYGLPLPGHQRAYPSTPPLGSRDHLFGHQPEAVLFPHGNPPCAEGAFRAAQKPTKGVGHVSG